jgi:hypothetical protein
VQLVSITDVLYRSHVNWHALLSGSWKSADPDTVLYCMRGRSLAILARSGARALSLSLARVKKPSLFTKVTSGGWFGGRTQV